jgi:hypothetical protein
MLMAIIAIMAGCTGSKKNKTETGTTDVTEVSATDTNMDADTDNGTKDAKIDKRDNKPEKASVKYRITDKQPYEKDTEQITIMTADNYGGRWRLDTYSSGASHRITILNHIEKTLGRGNAAGESSEREYDENYVIPMDSKFLCDWSDYSQTGWTKLSDTTIAGKTCKVYTKIAYDFKKNPRGEYTYGEWNGVMMYYKENNYDKKIITIWQALTATTDIPEIAFDKTVIEPTWIK